jgi:2-C-methyl-D-erythritol 4-phosphate cytidylyltransferase
VTLNGESLLGHALSRVLAVRALGHVVVVAPRSHLAAARAVADATGRPEVVDVVPGGRERTESVAAGLAALRPDDQVVLVHDAARALAPPELFEEVVAAVRAGSEAVVPGLPVVDTIKAVGEGEVVEGTPDRSRLRAVQTPQGFTRELLERAHASGASASDDAGLVERIGAHVRVVPGDQRAMKVTTPHDLAVAALFLDEEKTSQVSASPQHARSAGPRA